MRIRKVKEGDLEVIIDIFSTEGKKDPYLYNFTRKKLVDLFGPALKKKEMWVAEFDGKVIGFIWGGISSSSKKVAYVDELWVLSDFHGKGVGGRLMDTFEKYYKKKGANKIRLTAYSKSKAFGFYEKINYRPSKELVLMEKVI